MRNIQKSLLLVTSALIISPAAWAQDPATADNNGYYEDEIIVTSQKRAQSLQDVPISVSAFKGESLKQQGIETPKDFTAKVPNVNLSFNTGEQASVEVRGIASTFFAQNTDSPAGFYLDEVYTAARSAQIPQFFDLERVEILRGPQGTLYGRNTTAGAFNFISRKPDANGDTNGFVDLTVGKFGQVDIQGAFETPISDKVSVRLAGQKRYRDGYGRNGDGGKINDVDDIAGRFSIRYQGERSDATLRVFGNKTRNGGVYWQEGFSDPAGTNPLSAFFWDPTFVPDPDIDVIGANQQRNEVDNIGATFTFEHDFDAVTLTSISSVLNSKNDMSHEFDGRPQDLGLIDPFFSDVNQISQELRLTSAGAGPLNWIIGANYFKSDIEVDNTYIIDGISVGLPVNIGDVILNVNTFGEEETVSMAVFGDVNYDLSDRARINLGLRYTKDKKNINYSVINPLTFFTDPTTIAVDGGTAADFGLAYTDMSGIAINVTHEEKWSEPTWKVGLDYDISDNTMGYISYARGYRAGGFNLGPWFETSEGLPFNPESVDSFEGGLKNRLFDNRLTANLSLFYYKFNDIQVNVPQAIGLTIANAGKSKGYGAELELNGRVTDNWDISIGAGVLKGEFTEFVQGPVDRSGEEFGMPSFTANIYSEYRVPVDYGNWFVRGDLSYRGEERFGSDPVFFQTQGGYTRVDGQVGLSLGDRPLEFSLWVKNLTDTRKLTASDPVPPWMLEVSYNEPRSFGARAVYRWGE